MTVRTVVSPNPLTDDAEQILDAIRSGSVDAFVVQEHEGHAVYALESADLPYSTLVQRMQQGAAMLNAGGEVIYCNPSLGALLSQSGNNVVGTALLSFIEAGGQEVFRKLLKEAATKSVEGEVSLRRQDGSLIPVRLSLTALSRDGSITGLLVTDLTGEKSYAQLASSIQRLQDEERRTIARELHDSVGQLLAAVAMNLNRLRKEGANLSGDLAALLDNNLSLVDQVTKEIRTISHLLHPPLLDVAGLASAVRWYVDGFAERSRIQVDLQIPTDFGRLPDDVEIAAFRVVQECLTNVYRHSGSPSCRIRMIKDANLLHMEISDEGRGITQSGNGIIPSSGLGLRGMQERIRQLGGTLQIDSTGKGTTITVVLPAPAVAIAGSEVPPAVA